jgi:cytochrome c-type biogenesis protein CcmH/NrfF
MFRRWTALSAWFVDMGLAAKKTPQGLKPRFASTEKSNKAKALVCLEAKTSNEAKTGNGFSLRRWTQAGMVCLLAVVMLGASPSTRFDRIGHEMMCTCGCGQILLECNHVDCPVSPVMIGELHARVDEGGSDNLVLNWFAAKYGATVLAAPIRGGFDNVAWIAPMAVFFLATIGTGFVIRAWRKRSPQHVAVGGGGAIVGGDEVRERIRRETEY